MVSKSVWLDRSNKIFSIFFVSGVKLTVTTRQKILETRDRDSGAHRWMSNNTIETGGRARGGRPGRRLVPDQFSSVAVWRAFYFWITLRRAFIRFVAAVHVRWDYVPTTTRDCVGGDLERTRRVAREIGSLRRHNCADTHTYIHTYRDIDETRCAYISCWTASKT